ncbi:hypothetical protein [Thiorhodovibrio frisius]|nr:hypothetical protein [Thiorhodovibrio frisius]
MPKTIHDKLAAIIAGIEQTGSAETLRLTVLKKWFEHEGRLTAFAFWMLARVIEEAKVSSPEAEALLEETKTLLGDAGEKGHFDRTEARSLRQRLHDFQSEIRYVHSTAVRIVREASLMRVEEALDILLGYGLGYGGADCPAGGYQLAARYCEHYDSRHGTNLNGPALARVQAIAAFVAQQEGLETASQEGNQRSLSGPWLRPPR